MLQYNTNLENFLISILYMTTLHSISVNLSEGQKNKLRRAYQNREEVTLRLANTDLTSNDVLLVPQQAVRKLEKHRNLGEGMQIKLSQSNIRKQEGSGIFSALMPLAKTVLPTLGKTLGLSALAGAASEGASQIIKKISGGQIFQIPNTNLMMLAQMANLLTKRQKTDLANAHQLGGDLLFRVNNRQVGNGLGTILASIGIPLAIDVVKKLTGSGAVRMGGPRGSNRGRGAPRLGAPPPYIGTWGKGKKKGQGLLLGKNSPFRNIPVLGAIL